MKKRLFFIALCVCLIAAIACGSVAYFTSSNTKTNKFMTAAYNPENPDNPTNPDDVFSVQVLEDATADPANPKSVGGTPNGSGGFDYSKLLPGSEAAKKVSVKNSGKYDAYVRMKITVSKAEAWHDVFGDGVNLAESLCDIDTANWELDAAATTTDGSADTETYVYYYAKSGVGTVLAGGETTEKPIFTKVTIPEEDFDAADFASVDGFTVSVLSETIQSDYTGTISEAFAAFDNQND